MNTEYSCLGIRCFSFGPLVVTVHSLPERSTTFISVLLYDLYEADLGQRQMKEDEWEKE